MKLRIPNNYKLSHVKALVVLILILSTPFPVMAQNYEFVKKSLDSEMNSFDGIETVPISPSPYTVSPCDFPYYWDNNWDNEPLDQIQNCLSILHSHQKLIRQDIEHLKSQLSS